MSNETKMYWTGICTTIAELRGHLKMLREWRNEEVNPETLKIIDKGLKEKTQDYEDYITILKKAIKNKE